MVIKYWKKKSLCISLSVILLDHVIAIGKNYYPQMFLEKCKYVIKETNLKKIFDEKEISSDADYEQNSDYEENSDEEILILILTKNISDEENPDKEN